MGSINFYSARNMAAAQTWYGSVTGATSTQLTISNGYNTGIYYGSFTYAGSTVYGTLTGFAEYAGSALLVSASGFSVNANLAANYINANQIQNFFALALSGQDWIAGSSQSDVLFGYGGPDAFVGSLGNDVLDGGDGDDIVSYNAGASSWIDVDLKLGTVTGAFGTQTLRSIENVIGTNFNDQLWGDGGNNLILGKGGRDIIRGEQGDDYLVGDDGIDAVDYATAPGSVTVNLALKTATGAAGSDHVEGFENIFGSMYGDRLTGDSFDNTFFPLYGNDTVDGGAGTDTVTYLQGSRADYTITGSVSELIVTGVEGADILLNVEYINFGSGPALSVYDVVPSFSLSPSSSSVNEGSIATFVLTTSNVTAGTQVAYTLSGLSNADVQGGSLAGFVTINTNGQGIISVPILADSLTEGAESLTVQAGGKTASLTVLDTSVAPVTPTYSLRAAGSSVNEGSRIDFVLTTTNVAAGTQLTYTLSGVTAADIEGGSLTGNFTVPANGISTFVVGLTADNLTEGAETLTASVAGVSASTTVNDTSRGTSNSIVGTSGSDKFVASPGSNVVDGGAGVDTVQYAFSRSAVSVTYKNGIITVSKAAGTDTITNVERLDFTNGDLIYDIANPNAPAAYRLYGGAFDRTPDEGGFRYWAETLDAGVSMNVVAASFIASAEFQARYGANLTNAAFVDALYQNVLHRPGEAAGVAYWNDVLDKKLAARHDVLVSFTQLPEYVGLSAANIDNGYWVA